MDFDGRVFTINSKDINFFDYRKTNLPKNLIFLVPLLNLIKVIKKIEENIFKLKQKKKNCSI